MAELNYTEAFRQYGAKLHNPGWSVSAITPKGELVVSLWQNLILKGAEPGTLVYRDVLSGWRGNPLGRAEYVAHLKDAFARKWPVRLVMARPKQSADEALVGNVPDESYIEKVFSVRPDLIGTLTEFDGDRLLFVFRLVR